MSQVLQPNFTAGGPYDQPPNFKLTECDVQMSRSDLDKSSQLLNYEDLVERYPPWPQLLLRYGSLNFDLDDVMGALEAYREAQKLARVGADKIFDDWLTEFTAYVDEIREEDDNAWSDPDGEKIVVPWEPIVPFEGFIHSEPPSSASLKHRWDSLSLTFGGTQVTEFYERLSIISTNELDGVFKLGGQSTRQLIREGFFSSAIDQIDPSISISETSLLEVLCNTQKGLHCIDKLLEDSDMPVTNDLIKAMHKIMMSSAHSRIGRVSESDGTDDTVEFIYKIVVGRWRERTVTAYSSGSSQDESGIVQFCPRYRIDEEMNRYQDLMNEYLSPIDENSPFAIAAWIHVAFARIYPFADGNGRISRILSSIPLLRAGFPPINIMANDPQRSNYIAALSIASLKHDLNPLIECFFEGMIGGMDLLENLSLDATSHADHHKAG